MQTIHSHQAFWTAQVQKMDGNPTRFSWKDTPVPQEGVCEFYHTLENESYETLNRIGNGTEIGRFIVFTLALQLLVSRYSRENTIAIDTPTLAGLSPADKSRAVSIIQTINGNESISSLINESKEVIVNSYRFQDSLPENRIQYSNILIGFDDIHTGESNPEGSYDLRIWATTKGKETILKLSFNPRSFSPACIRILPVHIETILAGFSKPGIKAGDINPLTPAEEKQLFSFNPLSELLPAEGIIELFDRQVSRNPQAAAIINGDEIISYAGLQKRVNSFAAHLINDNGIQNGDIVALLLPPGKEFITAVLGTLRASCIFLPLDPGAPHGRHLWILKESNAKVLVTNNARMFDFGEYAGRLVIADFLETTDAIPPAAEQDTNQPAYIIYTSGSTGTPKGVLVKQKSLLNYLHWADAYYFKSADEGNFALFTNPAFDFTLTTLFCPLLRGKTISVFDPGKDIRKMLESCFAPGSGIDTLKLTPAHISIIGNSGIETTGIRNIIAGGEELKSSHVEIIHSIDPRILVYNEYGPTEATIGCITGKTIYGEPVTIGKPISNTEIFILDDTLQPLPTGIPGQLFLSGECLAQGYFNDEVLTEKQFIFSSRLQKRLYRSGDLGKWLHNGEIEYLGRIDEQFKLRGYRIETSEIENALRSHPSVKDALVMPLSSGEEKSIAAFLIPGEEITAADLSGFLEGLLPAYMLPSHYTFLDAWPVNNNGKINKKALLPQLASQVQATEPPANELEAYLAALWKKILNTDSISVTENFFLKGGHSLKAIQMSALLYKDLGITVGVDEIFEAQHIRQLASVLQGRQAENYKPIPALPSAEHYALSYGQRRIWLAETTSEKKNGIFNIPMAFLLEGALDRQAFEYAIRELAMRHEILRTSFITIGGEPRQKIHPVLPIPITWFEKQEDPDDVFIRDFLLTETTTPFDLKNGPLFRVKCIPFTGNKHLTVLTLHHLVTDGWSVRIIAEEIAGIYSAYLKGEDFTEAAPAIHYKDFSAWQNELITGTAISAQREYWNKQLEGLLPVVTIPSDKPRPPVKTIDGSSFSFTIDASLSEKLLALSTHWGTSLYVTLLAAINVLVHRYTGEKDIILGTPVAGRNREELQKQIGVYLNILALRNRLEENDSFAETVKKITGNTWMAFRHADYPFDLLLEELNIKWQPSHSPVFNIGFTWNNAYDVLDSLSLEKMQLSLYPYKLHYAKHDLWFYGSMPGEQIGFTIEYNTGLYNENTIRELARGLQELLRQVCNNDTIRLPEIHLSENVQAGTSNEHLDFEFNFI